jgi:cation diffusion facilitator CzcD-associated flavoprotein CzcO
MGSTGFQRPKIAILGAGVAGLCMAMQLRRAGIDNFTVFDKSDGIGGTWRNNTYPGSGCDVPSHLYCFSFEPNPDWTRKFAEQSEILSYLERCATKYELWDQIRFFCNIVCN